VTSFGDGYDTIGLEGNASFNPVSPTLKDGTAITGDGLTNHDAAVYAVLNPTPGSEADIEASLASDNSYDVARAAQNTLDAITHLFRLTGDLRLLDRLCDGYAALEASWGVPWDATLYPHVDYAGRSDQDLCDGAGESDPWSPHPKVVFKQSSYWAAGTDLDPLQQTKIYSAMARFAWALHVNRGKTSPGGYNYDTLADTWGGAIEDHVDTWSGAGAECWRPNYHGDQYNSTYDVKAAWGTYPVLSRNESHAALATIQLTYYTGRLGDTGLWNIPNPGNALTKSHDMAASINNSLVDCAGGSTYGDSIIWSHSSLFTGGTDESQPATYTGYMAQYWTDLWMSGYFRDVFTADRMMKISRAFANMMDTGSVAAAGDDATLGTIAGGGILCGLNSNWSSSPRTALQVVSRGTSTMVAFAPLSEPKLESDSTLVQNVAGGGYTTPEWGVIPAAQFVGWALREIGDYTQ